ncbi:hypothetical protein MEG1DRAFT_03339 [Photorhabdus temperata subsp. temperata Meg1]|uniref:Uncharacterized protein n=2 Tax=Photorhabdus temperata TaxID=574560 RepID=A0A081RTM0_PHOTE|nr:hypothetical protein O185_23265 [Photorhabdus temperata J3]KER02023.1 hypothetical protein MEG1DRAFT_03339 [Photorhabdus temperata subsp. temperata Meg1]
MTQQPESTFKRVITQQTQPYHNQVARLSGERYVNKMNKGTAVKAVG